MTRPSPPRARVISRELRAGYTLEKVAIANGVEGAVTALFLLPQGSKGPVPAILWLHSSTPDKTQIIIPGTNGGAEPLGEAYVRAGYAVLAPDAYWHGDRVGTGPSGTVAIDTGRAEQEDLFKLNLWLGRTLWGMFVRDDLVALDYLCSRPEVDAARVGATGMSMGSTRAWWLAAVDPRVAAVVAVACFTRYQNLIAHGELRAHGVYYFVNGLLQHFDTEGVLALIAPRPLLALTGDLDAGSPADGVRDLERALTATYQALGARDHFRSVLYPEVGHVYTPEMRAETLAWFAHWLRPRDGPEPAGEPASAKQAATRLHELFKDEWEWTLREYPELATRVGDPRYNDRLTDLSASAIDRRKAHEREVLERIRGIDRSVLTGQDVLSYDLFRRAAEQGVALQRFPAGTIPIGGFLLPYEAMPITQMGGVQIDIPELPRVAPLRTTKDYDDFLARLAAYPRQVDQVIDLMKRAMAAGWMPPAAPLSKVLPQIEKQWVDDVARSPLYRPFETFPDAVAAADRARLVARAREMIAGAIIPTLKALHAFIAGTYLPACRPEIAASGLPGGPAFYEAQVRFWTTTDLSPGAIHEIGRREVARIRKAMDDVIRQAEFAGPLPEFIKFLRTDPRFALLPPDEVLPAFRDIAKRVDPELPRLFAELPRMPYGIREIPAFRGQTAAHYTPGADDGSRAGFFNANTLRGTTRPRHEMEALLLHEAVPGHHLQVARAQELRGLPEFRRNALYGAYTEGWGLYAESLGEDLGLYKDPYAKFGRLQGEMLRACRLVVDTGIHALGWTRQQAIDFMDENTGVSESHIAAEVDRYIVWPGQALGYKIGELKIQELRARSARALGAKFDLRAFHNALIDDGALPLDLLEQRIDEWIKGRQ
jgi:uncharacterized protein (DUF885 family)/dienelactone hydrolase